MENIGKIKEENQILKKKISELEKSLKTETFEKDKANDFINKAGVVLIALDKKGNITLANNKACQVLGCKDDKLIGKNWFDNFIKKEIIAEVKDVFSNIISGNLAPVEYYTNPIWNTKGEKPIISWRNSVLRDEKDKIIGLISSGNDITDEIESEKRLIDSEKRLQTLSDASFEAIFISEKGICLDQNHTAERMFGYKLEEAIGKPGTDWIIPENRDVVINNMKNSVLKPYEVVALRKDGSTFPCEIQARIITIEGIQLRVTALRDISVRRQAELELKQSEEKYRLIADNTSDIIWILDVESNTFLFVSPSVKKSLGYSPEEVIKNGLDGVLSPPSIEYLNTVVPQRIERFKNGEREIFKDVLEQKHKNGSNVWTEVHAHYYRNSKTGRIEALGSSRDITKRWKIQQSLEKSEQLYRLLFNLLPYGGEVLDKKGVIVKCSPSTAKLLGYELSELEGTHITSLLTNDSIDIFKSKFPEILKGKALTADIKMKHKSGKEIDILRAAQPISDKLGNVEAVLALNVDMTEHRKTVNELITAKERVEESDRLKSAFLANMSHEIRTPMNGIMGFTNLLKDPDISESNHQKYVNIIRKSGNRMLDTVNNIIEISKIETNQIDLFLSDVNVNEMVEDQYNFFKHETDKRGLELNFSLGLGNSSSFIRTDKLMLNSILTNLIKNAVKYTKKGRISFGYTNDGGYLKFYVQDTGIGIAINRRDAIFKRFIQADIEDKQAYEGSGLGLSIAHAYAELLNGEMWVESQEGAGSIFYFTIPYQQVAQNTEEKLTDSNEGNKPKINKLKILIAEDDSISEMHLAILLKEIATELLSVKSGDETVKICRENPDIDLILMDIKMPIMDGYEATREIRKFNKKVPIIAQTAYALQGDREKALQTGCNEYITKPIEKEILYALISELVNNSK